MSQIYLIRHGQASFGEEDYDQLSPLGYQQASKLADYLIQTGVRFDAFYLGENRRHAQTLGEFKKKMSAEERRLPVNTVAEFNEYDFEGVLRRVIPSLIEEEPAFREEVESMFTDNRKFQAVFEKTLINWLETPERYPEIYSWSDFSEGVVRKLMDILESGGAHQTIALFTSGGVISAIIQAAMGLSDQEALKISWQLVNVSITRVMYRKKDLILSGFNDIGFLRILPDKKLITYR